jgi:hypothetical protein
LTGGRQSVNPGRRDDLKGDKDGGGSGWHAVFCNHHFLLCPCLIFSLTPLVFACSHSSRSCGDGWQLTALTGTVIGSLSQPGLAQLLCLPRHQVDARIRGCARSTKTDSENLGRGGLCDQLGSLAHIRISSQSGGPPNNAGWLFKFASPNSVHDPTSRGRPPLLYHASAPVPHSDLVTSGLRAESQRLVPRIRLANTPDLQRYVGCLFASFSHASLSMSFAASAADCIAFRQCSGWFGQVESGSTDPLFALDT